MKEQAVRRTLMSNLANIETVLEKIEDKFSGLTATSGNLKSELRTLNYKLKSIYLELQIPESKLKQRQTLIKDTEQKQQENNVYSHKIHGMKSLLIDITEKKANSLKELQVLQESYILLDQNINTKRQSLISRKKNHELNISEINRASEAILESKLDIDERNQILGRALCYLEERLVKIKIGEEKLIDVERVLSEKVKNNNDEKDKYRTPASRKNVETLNQKISEISIKEMKIKKLEKQRELKKLE